MDEPVHNFDSSRWRRSLIFIFSVALLTRIVFVLTLQDGFYFADAPLYSAAASHILEYGEFPEDYGRNPLYPLFLAGVFALAGEDVIILRIVQAVLGGCIALLIAVIGKRTGGVLVGAIAGILWAIYPMGVFIAGLTYPTTLVTALLVGGVLCLISDPGHHGYPAKIALAGLLFGLAALAKPIVLGTIVFISFWIVFWRRTGRVLLASIFLMTAVATLLPWTVRNAYVYDRLVPIEARNLDKAMPWVEAPDDQSGSENKTWKKVRHLASRFPHEFVSFFELYPRRVNFLKQSVRDKSHSRGSGIVRFTVFGSNPVMALSIISVGFIFTFAMIGIWAMWRDKDKRPELSLFIMMVLSFALGYATAWGKIRYRIPVDPYIIVLSSWGVLYAWNRLVKRQRVPGQ